MRKAGFLLLIFLFTYGMTGCSRKQEEHELLIGVAWPFEKSDSMFSKGLELALEEVNLSGGVYGKVLKLIKADDEGQLVKALSVAREFAEDDKIKAVIGHRNSFISVPASSVYEEAGKVMLSPSSTAPELTEKGYQNIFRMIPDDNQLAEKIADYIAAEGRKQMVIFYTDDSYGTGLANSFEDCARQKGITVVDRFNYYGGKEDLLLLERRWQSLGYDGIFIAATAQDGADFIQAAELAGIRTSYYAGNTLDSPVLTELAGGIADGLVVASVFDHENEASEVQSFIKSFQEKYGEMPEAYAALGYDSIKMIAAALEAQAQQEAADLASILRNLGAFQGAVGLHQTDDKGNESGDLVVLKQLKQGSFHYLR